MEEVEQLTAVKLTRQLLYYKVNEMEHSGGMMVCGVIPRRHTALQTGRSRVGFPIVSFEFFIDLIFPAALWSWGRLSL